MKEIGPFLLEKIKASGRRKKDIAAATGLPVSYISNLTKNLDMRLSTLDKFVTALQIDGREIFSYAPAGGGAPISAEVMRQVSTGYGSPEISYLRQQLLDKETLLAEKERIVAEKERLVIEKERTIEMQAEMIRMLSGKSYPKYEETTVVETVSE